MRSDFYNLGFKHLSQTIKFINGINIDSPSVASGLRYFSTQES